MAGSPQHATLVANTVTTLTFDKDAERVEVTNVDGAAAVYFTVGSAAPAVAATGSNVVTAGAGAFLEVPGGDNTRGSTVVKLISTGTPKVSVRAW